MFFRNKYVHCEVAKNALNFHSLVEFERYCLKIQEKRFPIPVNKIVSRNPCYSGIPIFLSAKAVQKIQKDKDAPIKILDILDEGLTEKEVMSRLMG